MDNVSFIAQLINETICETDRFIDCLYITCNSCEKNKLLNQVRRNMGRLCALIRQLQETSLQPLVSAPVYTTPSLPAISAAPVYAAPLSPMPVNNTAFLQPERSFTPAELARYNGKNGYPAYVAVNGTVYDVTDNMTWAAASHFGLSAGNDVTQAFYSCHAGQQVLSKLNVVGKMTA